MRSPTKPTAAPHAGQTSSVPSQAKPAGADYPEVPGIPCPGCGQRLVVTMATLLGQGKLACGCGLVLRVDAQRSRETLDDLRQLQQRLSHLPG